MPQPQTRRSFVPARLGDFADLADRLEDRISTSNGVTGAMVSAYHSAYATWLVAWLAYGEGRERGRVGTPLTLALRDAQKPLIQAMRSIAAAATGFAIADSDLNQANRPANAQFLQLLGIPLPFQLNSINDYRRQKTSPPKSGPMLIIHPVGNCKWKLEHRNAHGDMTGTHGRVGGKALPPGATKVLVMVGVNSPAPTVVGHNPIGVAIARFPAFVKFDPRTAGYTATLTAAYVGTKGVNSDMSGEQTQAIPGTPSNEPLVDAAPQIDIVEGD